MASRFKPTFTPIVPGAMGRDNAAFNLANALAAHGLKEETKSVLEARQRAHDEMKEPSSDD